MKYLNLIFFILFCFSENIAQVGINTTNPQEEVHVAGSIENIRIEGLNDTNNVDNYGEGQTTRVFTDGNGDLILGSMDDDFELLIDTDNYLRNVQNPTNLINQTGTGYGYTPAGIPAIANPEFTLTKKAIVEINYSVSWNIYHIQSQERKRIEDQRAKIIQTGVYFRYDDIDGEAVIYDGNGDLINGVDGETWCINANPSDQTCLEEAGFLALNGQFYNNGDAEHGSYKYFKNTASDFVILGPGTYILLFAAKLQVDETQASGASRIYLGHGKDELQLVAYYFNE